jgi:hypothetical protein
MAIKKSGRVSAWVLIGMMQGSPRQGQGRLTKSGFSRPDRLIDQNPERKLSGFFYGHKRASNSALTARFFPINIFRFFYTFNARIKTGIKWKQTKTGALKKLM